MAKPLTATEKRLYSILIDGQPHTINELLDTFDRPVKKTNVRVHIGRIRRKIRDAGLGILAEEADGLGNDACTYRLVQFFANPYEE